MEVAQSAILDKMRREAIGQRLRAERTAKGWTLAQMGDASDTPPETLCRIELGRRWPQLTTLYRIAGALGVSVRELL